MGGGNGGSATPLAAARDSSASRRAQVVFLRPQALEEIAVLVRHAFLQYVVSGERYKSGRGFRVVHAVRAHTVLDSPRRPR
jgi:hypothetical protein